MDWGLPADWVIESDLHARGEAMISASGSTPVSGAADLLVLLAAVPYSAVSKSINLIHISDVSLNEGAIEAISAPAVHVVNYLGDSNANDLFEADPDAALIADSAIGLISGFSALPSIDPVLGGRCNRRRKPLGARCGVGSRQGERSVDRRSAGLAGWLPRG